MENHLTREELFALDHHLSNIEGIPPYIGVEKEVVATALVKMYLCLSKEMLNNEEVRDAGCLADLQKMGDSVSGQLDYIMDYRQHVRKLFDIYKKHRLFSLKISDLNGYEAQELIGDLIRNLKDQTS